MEGSVRVGTSQPWGQAGRDGETGYPNDGHVPHGTSTAELRTGGDTHDQGTGWPPLS